MAQTEQPKKKAAPAGDRDGPTPTDPLNITAAWVRDFKRELLALPKHLLTPTERMVITVLADALIVRPKNGPPPKACGTWTISQQGLADRVNCSLPSAKRAIQKAMRLGIVRQIWRGHNFHSDTLKAKASCYSLERPSIAVELDPSAWEDTCAPVQTPRGGISRDPSADHYGGISPDTSTEPTEGSALILPQALRKDQPGPHGGISPDPLTNHTYPVGATPTARLPRPVRSTPPESVVAESLSTRRVGEHLQHSGSSPSSSSEDGFRGSSSSEADARFEARTVEAEGDRLNASSVSPNEPERVVEYLPDDLDDDDIEDDLLLPDDLDLEEPEDGEEGETSDILDLASPEEDSPDVPVVFRVDLPFEVKLELATQFAAIDSTELDAQAFFMARGRLVKAALERHYGQGTFEAEYWGDLVRPIQSLVDTRNDQPPPITLEDFERLSSGPGEDLIQ